MHDAFFEEIEGEDEKHAGDPHGEQCFVFTVSVRMVFVNGLAGEMDADEAEHVACAVGQGVEAVRGHARETRHHAVYDLGGGDEPVQQEDRQKYPADPGVMRLYLFRICGHALIIRGAG